MTTVPVLPELPADLRISRSSRALLKWSIEQLRRHQIEEAAYESRCLIAHALGMKPSLLHLSALDLEPEQMEACAELIRRRAAQEPFQYLLGETGFRRGIFTCRPGVLIPRPETETLVERAALRLLVDPSTHRRVLELGTGSGAAIISLAMDYPRHTYVATDIDPVALELAQENAQRNSVADRILFLEGDWWEALRAARIQLPFDVILSNPPYIPTVELDRLPVEIRDHEPLTALDGGPDGLKYYRRLVGELFSFLKPEAWVIVEVGDGQAGAVQSLFENVGLQHVEVTFDLHNLPRVVAGQRPVE